MNLFWRLSRWLAPWRWQVALAVMLGVLMIACNVGLLGMAAYLISAAALRPLLIALTIPIYLVRFAGVARAATRYVERLVGHSLTFHMLGRVRTRLYGALATLAPGQLGAFRSGDLLTRLVADVEELQNLYLRLIGPLLVAALATVLTSWVFALFSPTLAWVSLAFLVGAGVGIPLLTGWLSRGMGARQLAVRSALNTQFLDGIQGVRDILAFGGEATFQMELDRQGNSLAKLQRRDAWITGMREGLNELIQVLAIWVVLVLSIPLVRGHVIGGVYLALLAFVMLASFEAVQPLALAFQLVGRTTAAGQRIFQVLDTPATIADPAVPHVLAPDHAQTLPTLRFEGVSFRYAAGEADALTEISFTARAGSRIALVGPSGAGKSTLAKLAVRFADPTRGVIRLDGIDLREYALRDLRAAVSVVAQDTYLFNNTLRANLLLGRPDASADELAAALEQAQLTAFTRQLPDGLNTWVGEQGTRLSGGERQRLAIARALLRDAPLLILDEPTANLDPATEREVLTALDRLMRERTTLLITHRLLAMERMDEILVLDGGRLVERGTHASLLASDGLYRRMVETQENTLTLDQAMSGFGVNDDHEASVATG